MSTEANGYRRVAVVTGGAGVLWQRSLPTMNFGAATVANDVVFKSDYAGTVWAFDTKTGNTVWTAKAPAGIDSFPAIDGGTLLVGAATGGFSTSPKFQLVAYFLSGVLLGRGEVFLGPAGDLFERGQQRPACVGELVGDGNGWSVVDGAGGEPDVAELGESVGEHRVADAVDGARDGTETRWAAAQGAQ